MSIQTNSPSTNLGTSVSADEIAVLLGFADAAAMVAAIGQYCIAGGTTNAYTATPAIPWTSYSDGDRVTVRIPNFVNTGASTINVSGLGAKNIYKMSQGANVQLTGYELYYGHMATLVYSGLAGGFILESSFSLRAADIPSTLNATTFGGDVILAKGVNTDYSSLLRAAANDYLISLCGGSAIGGVYGAYIQMWGNSHYSTPGDAKYYTGTASGAAHSFFDKNGVEQLKIDENGAGGATYGELFFSGGVGVRIRWNYGASPQPLLMDATGIFLGNTTHGGLYCYRTDYATYPGAHQQFAPLSTRAASTAIALCPVATGDTAKVEISETTIADCLTFVDAAGTVTLYDKLGGTVSASIVNSSSPAAGEYGVYISAGVLYFKGGSSYAGKMGSFSKVWKA